jgi:hypothetical protein
MDAVPEDNTVRSVYRNALYLPRIRYEEILANTAEGVFVELPRELVRHVTRAALANIFWL